MSGAPDPRRWWALVVLVTAQLMLTLDVTIVNIALTSAQADLGLDDASRQWVVTAYALPFGGLLLLGGRIADAAGRRRVFIVSLIGFAAASALGGLASEPWMLYSARALQGVFGAAMAPALLSMLTLLFPTGSERARAFGIFTAVSAAGGATGLLLGGVLTEALSWRWCLLVNLPIALLVAVAALRILSESRAGRPQRFDLGGAIAVTAGLFALVYGATHAAEHGWGDPGTVTPLAAGVILLVAFLGIERGVSAPLLPTWVLSDSSRTGSFLVLVLGFAANTGMLLIIVVYLQQVQGMTAIESGLGFLPYMLAVVPAAWLAARLAAIVSPRLLVAAGGGFCAAGMLVLASIEPGSSYAGVILPGLILAGAGAALLFMPTNSIALLRIPADQSGVISGTLTASQQGGGALGVAAVNTVAVSATATFLAERGPSLAETAAVHGFGRSMLVAAGLMVAAAFAGLVLVRTARQELADVDLGTAIA